jgi:membrane-bound acyltransferase YfiQ involved in biofilm formation
MTVVIILLALLTLIGTGFGFSALVNYANTKYKFNIFGFGWLSLIPPALASLGFFVVTYRGTNYWEALQLGDIDVVISLVLATIAFIGIITLIYRRTNLWVALLIMLIAPPCLLVSGFLLAAAEAQNNNKRGY